jgi:hypothetical protein
MKIENRTFLAEILAELKKLEQKIIKAIGDKNGRDRQNLNRDTKDSSKT